MLDRIIEYLKRKRFATLEELASFLKISKNTAEPMLEILVRKNYLKKNSDIHSGCSNNCRNCLLGSRNIYYIWEKN